MTDNNQAPGGPASLAGGLFTPERKMAAIVYIFYLLSLVVGITSIIGVVMAYVFRGEADETIRSHYEFQIRTFWIGLLIGVIGLILTFVLIGILVLLALLVWFVVRCVIGLKYLNEGKPVPNPKSWMIGTES